MTPHHFLFTIYPINRLPAVGFTPEFVAFEPYGREPCTIPLLCHYITMIEVFKTNVKCRMYAHLLVEEIHKMNAGYTANFDLDDCDNILRVKSSGGTIHSEMLILLLKQFGFHAEVLPDEIPSPSI